jgi:hypothetical protein
MSRVLAHVLSEVSLGPAPPRLGSCDVMYCVNTKQTPAPMLYGTTTASIHRASTNRAGRDEAAALRPCASGFQNTKSGYKHSTKGSS